MIDEKNAAEPSGASGGYAVGDCLAFYCGLGLSSRWEIHKVTKITPSGRLTCGPYTLNADLSVRGSSGYSGPHRAEPVTKEIVLEVRRRRALEYVKGFDWSTLDADRLEAVVAVTRQA